MRGAPSQTREEAEAGLAAEEDRAEDVERDTAWVRYEKTRMRGDVDRITAFRAGWRAGRRSGASDRAGDQQRLFHYEGEIARLNGVLGTAIETIEMGSTSAPLLEYLKASKK